MIAFNSDFEEFFQRENSFRKDFSIGIINEIIDHENNKRVIEEELMFLGKEFKIIDYQEYSKFIRRSSKLAPRYSLYDMHIDIISELTMNKIEKNLMLTAQFPSKRCHPYVVFDLFDKRCTYTYMKNSAYDFIVKGIRKRKITTKKERIFANIIAYEMDDEGRLDDIEILEKDDVLFSRSISLELLNNSFEEM